MVYYSSLRWLSHSCRRQLCIRRSNRDRPPWKGLTSDGGKRKHGPKLRLRDQTIFMRQFWLTVMQQRWRYFPCTAREINFLEATSIKIALKWATKSCPFNTQLMIISVCTVTICAFAKGLSSKAPMMSPCCSDSTTLIQANRRTVAPAMRVQYGQLHENGAV